VVITTSEHDLKKDLSTVKRKLMSFNKFSNLWVGITGNSRFRTTSSNVIYLTMAVEHSPSWEDDNHSASQEILCLL
jgi:hypothetical protein